MRCVLAAPFCFAPASGSGRSSSSLLDILYSSRSELVAEALLRRESRSSRHLDRTLSASFARGTARRLVGGGLGVVVDGFFFGGIVNEVNAMGNADE